MGQTYQISSNLCDVAMKYLKLCETFDSTGHANFFSKIYQLFYENRNNMSVNVILCDVRIPLYVKEWRENDATWNEFENNYHMLYDFKRIEIMETQSCSNNYILGLKTIEKISNIFDSEKYLYNIYLYLQLISTIIPGISKLVHLFILFHPFFFYTKFIFDHILLNLISNTTHTPIFLRLCIHIVH